MKHVTIKKLNADGSAAKVSAGLLTSSLEKGRCVVVFEEPIVPRGYRPRWQSSPIKRVMPQLVEYVSGTLGIVQTLVDTVNGSRYVIIHSS